MENNDQTCILLDTQIVRLDYLNGGFWIVSRHVHRNLPDMDEAEAMVPCVWYPV